MRASSVMSKVPRAQTTFPGVDTVLIGVGLVRPVEVEFVAEAAVGGVSKEPGPAARSRCRRPEGLRWSRNRSKLVITATSSKSACVKRRSTSKQFILKRSLLRHALHYESGRGFESTAVEGAARELADVASALEQSLAQFRV
jgi:hypothetical protein